VGARGGPSLCPLESSTKLKFFTLTSTVFKHSRSELKIAPSPAVQFSFTPVKMRGGAGGEDLFNILHHQSFFMYARRKIANRLFVDKRCLKVHFKLGHCIGIVGEGTTKKKEILFLTE
jgi:hypothetical protein